jgi:hypothetical protein
MISSTSCGRNQKQAREKVSHQNEMNDANDSISYQVRRKFLISPSLNIPLSFTTNNESQGLETASWETLNMMTQDFETVSGETLNMTQDFETVSGETLNMTQDFETVSWETLKRPKDLETVSLGNHK